MITGRNVLLGIVLSIFVGFSLYSILDSTPASSKQRNIGKQSEDIVEIDPWITEVIPAGGSLYGIMENNGIPLR